MCYGIFPHLALQNCTCKTVYLCHSCSHLDGMLPWYSQALTVLVFFYPFICADIPLQIKHSAVCTKVEALVDIQPCTTENPTENVPTFMSHSEVYERKDACLHTFHYLTGSIREWRQHQAQTQKIQGFVHSSSLDLLYCFRHILLPVYSFFRSTRSYFL